jgi:hypothetical protein
MVILLVLVLVIMFVVYMFIVIFIVLYFYHVAPLIPPSHFKWKLIFGSPTPFHVATFKTSLPMHKLPKTHFSFINLNLLSKRNPQRQRSMKLIGHFTRGQLGHFHDMCVKYTPPKYVEFNFGLHFLCLGVIIIFTKLMLL